MSMLLRRLFLGGRRNQRTVSASFAVKKDDDSPRPRPHHGEAHQRQGMSDDENSQELDEALTGTYDEEDQEQRLEQYILEGFEKLEEEAAMEEGMQEMEALELKEIEEDEKRRREEAFWNDRAAYKYRMFKDEMERARERTGMSEAEVDGILKDYERDLAEEMEKMKKPGEETRN